MRRALLLALVLIPGLWAPTGISAEPPKAQSPTGRTPKLLWRPEQQAVWDRMRKENHPWWRLIKDTADRTGTKNETYADYGQWATLVYQMTGDKAYAAKAWDKIAQTANELPSSRNWTREYFAEYVVLYDWLYPALTREQRAQLLDTMNGWADLVLDKGKRPWGTRAADSDETVGHYFGLALLDVATGPDNPRAGSFLKSTWTDLKPKSVGGLDADAADFATMRNALRKYVETAAGGEWIESSDYNLGTLKLLLIGVEGARTATGKDHFPEVKQFIKQAALAQLHSFAPDLKAAFQWGDEEHPRELLLWKRVTLLGILAGLTRDDPDVGPYLNQLVWELAEKYGYTGYETAQPWARIFYFFDPYTERADWRKKLPPHHYAAGTGILTARTGWQGEDSLFIGHMPGRTFVDHEVSFFGDFQLYRKGEWAVTHPLGYGGTPNSGEATNSMLIAGLSSMSQQRSPVAHAVGPEGWAYLAGTTSGQYYDQPYYEPPPTFLHEWARSLFYLPSKDRTVDTVVVFDRVKADNPAKLPKLDRYRAPDRSLIVNAPALKQWVIHSPVAPTEAEDGLSWKTPGGQRVLVSTLSGHRQTRKVYAEAELWGKEKLVEFKPAEVKHQARLMPVEEKPWTTFLNVVQAGDPDVPLRNSRVASEGGEAEGALVKRPGHTDVLVLFGAKAEGRVLKDGYTVSWDGAGGSAEVFLFDLDPETRWSVRAGGLAPRALKVSSEGVARLPVEGGGKSTLKLTRE